MEVPSDRGNSMHGQRQRGVKECGMSRVHEGAACISEVAPGETGAVRGRRSEGCGLLLGPGILLASPWKERIKERAGPCWAETDLPGAKEAETV